MIHRLGPLLLLVACGANDSDTTAAGAPSGTSTITCTPACAVITATITLDGLPTPPDSFTIDLGDGPVEWTDWGCYSGDCTDGSYEIGYCTDHCEAAVTLGATTLTRSCADHLQGTHPCLIGQHAVLDFAFSSSTVGTRALDCHTPTCGDAELGATANNGGSTYLPEVICALEALRDADSGSAGQLRVGTFSDVDTGRTLVIDGASRDVLEQAFDGGSQGIPLTLTPVDRCPLADASYFQGCLDSPSLSCLDTNNWFTNCTSDPTAVCP